MRGKHELFRVVGALRHPGGFPRGLNRGEKQGDEYANNRDHDEKLDEGKALARRGFVSRRMKISLRSSSRAGVMRLRRENS